MAKLGAFSADTVAKAWFDETALAEGFFSPELIDAVASGTLTLRSSGVDQADASSYSEASQATGTAGAVRAVHIWGRENATGTAGLPETCTIGGEALARVDASLVSNNVGGANPKMCAGWFIGAPSVGGNQTVAFTFTEGGTIGGTPKVMIRAGWAVYEADGYSTTVHDAATDGASAEGDTTLSATIDVPEGGGLLGAGVISDLDAAASALTGIGTEDVDALDASGNAIVCAGHQDGLSAETGRAVGVVFASGGVWAGDDAVFTAISLALAGGVETKEGSAQLGATGVPTATGQKVAQGSAQLSATGAITATGEAVAGAVEGAAQLSATGALTATSVKIAQGSAQIGATAAITATGEAVGATPEPEVRPDAGGGGSKRYWRGVAGRVSRDDVNAILAKLRGAKRKKSVKVLVAAIKQAPPALVSAIAPSIAPVLELPILSVNTGENRQQIEAAYAAVMSALALEREAALEADDEEVEELLLMYDVQRRRIVAMALEVLAS